MKGKQAGTSKAASIPSQAPVPHYDTSTSSANTGVTFSSPYIDRSLNAFIGKITQGLSPIALINAFFEWEIHLTMSPGKQYELREKSWNKNVRLLTYSLQCMLNPNTSHCIAPLPQDQRFQSEKWHSWPFNIIHQSFLLTQQWWHNAAIDIRGVSKHTSDVVSFVLRQWLDIFSPSNFIHTNPEILESTAKQGGLNLAQGMVNFIEDYERTLRGAPPVGAEKFRPGEVVAITPGQVIYRNELIELIQYTPTTDKVLAEPIFIVPAWIMKYYILDLSPHNSLIKYLVDKGHTVFTISWKNPTREDRNLGMDDYRTLGVMKALDVINTVCKDQHVHMVGYCLGGTLSLIAAATMARDGDHRLKSLTLFAAQSDFTEAGELGLFIDENQITFLEDLMWEQGYLDAKQMAGAFQILRSQDLLWSKMVHDYLMGERTPLFDLMAWNADATRLPYHMHSEYLRRLFLDNQLAEGRYEVEGYPIALGDIRIPIFCVATQKDHVAPWRSVYKLHLFTETDLTFVLTNGGHNVGIVNEPGHPHRSYQIATHSPKNNYRDPDVWLAETPSCRGSWWPAWQDWLTRHSSSAITPSPCGNPGNGYPPLSAAPGTYIFQN